MKIHAICKQLASPRCAESTNQVSTCQPVPGFPSFCADCHTPPAHWNKSASAAAAAAGKLNTHWPGIMPTNCIQLHDGSGAPVYCLCNCVLAYSSSLNRSKFRFPSARARAMAASEALMVELLQSAASVARRVSRSSRKRRRDSIRLPRLCLARSWTTMCC